MDLLTQAALGGAVAAALARDGERRAAIVAGAMAGLLPDADVLIRSAADPLLALEVHRTFTHAVLFAPVLGALVAALIHVSKFSAVGFSRLALFAIAGCLTHGPLDACTSYGTQLGWPISGARIALCWIAVVDPVFTVTLLVGLTLTWRRRRSRPVRVALVVCAAYLLLAAVQQARVRAVARAQPEMSRVRQLVVKPTLGNLLLWRCVAIDSSGERVHAMAIHAWPLGTPKVLGSQHRSLARPDSVAPDGSRQQTDLVRFERLSGQFLVRHPDDPNVIGDARYAMLPHEVRPLWGVRLDPSSPGTPPPFVTTRDAGPRVRATFWRMLRGDPAP